MRGAYEVFGCSKASWMKDEVFLADDDFPDCPDCLIFISMDDE